MTRLTPAIPRARLHPVETQPSEPLLDLSSEYQDLLFGVRRSVRYHAHRIRFFDQASKTIRILAGVSGIGTITTLMASTLGPAWPASLAAAVTFFSAIDVVIDFAGMARRHTDLYRRFIELEKLIVSSGQNINQQRLNELVSVRLTIELDEPPVLGVLNAICHNELIRSMDLDKNEMADITPIQRLFSDLFDICPSKLCKHKDAA